MSPTVVKRKSESVCSEDVHGLPYTLEQQKTLRQPEAARKYNSLGFGAGGLPPLTHSHLARNWCQGSLELQEEEEEEGEGVELGEEPVAEGYGPGMELIRLPKAEGLAYAGGGGEGGEGSEGGRASEDEDTRRTDKPSDVGIVARVTVPSSQIKRRDGGRGKARAKVVKPAKSEQPFVKQPVSKCMG